MINDAIPPIVPPTARRTASVDWAEFEALIVVVECDMSLDDRVPLVRFIDVLGASDVLPLDDADVEAVGI